MICPATAHINTDECGAAERLTGAKPLDVETVDGKVTPDLVRTVLATPNGEHNVQPAVIAISQVTELGTVYTRDEITALADLAHEHGLTLFLDGARLSNAAAPSRGDGLGGVLLGALPRRGPDQHPFV